MNEGLQVNLTWKAETVSQNVILERAGIDGEYIKIAEDLNPAASFTDEQPRSGWNYYRLLDANGAAIATQKVFVKGRSELNVFPNPSSNHITLSMPECDALDEGYILVFNALTKCLMEKQVRFGEGNSVKIDISELESGLYTLVLQAHGATLTKTILVSK